MQKMIPPALVASYIALSIIALFAMSGGAYALPESSSKATTTGEASTRIRIGVLAHRGAAQALHRWSLTARYLSSKIAGHHFEIVPLDLDGIRNATLKDEIHFTLTNPGNYADLEARFGISRIATLQTREGDQIRVRYGAVIITQTDNTDIQNLEDLKGKSFMAVSEKAFGGFQMAWRELADHGIDPFKDLSKLQFAGFPQDKIVLAVANEDVDAATVRAETFARMVESGTVNMEDFRVLNPQPYANSPFPVSTTLYPEWPFATLKKTPRELATQVTQALLSMPDYHPAAVSAHSAGWTIPLDYSPVTELMRSLKIGPFEVLRETSLWALVKRYANWFIGTGVALISLILLSGYVTRTNRRLRETERNLRLEISQRVASQAALASYRDTLEEQVMERTHDLSVTNQALEKSRVALRKLVQISSAPELNHQQRLEQLLETGRKYFNLDVAVLSSVEDDIQKVCTTSGNVSLVPETGGVLQKICASQLAESPGEPIDIPDTSECAIEESTCHKLGWRSYLGVGVMLDGHISCTLEFAGTKTREQVLSQWDHEILKVMAQWIADELERQRAVEAQNRHETEFARVSRMSTIGEMAASLAHELNQPLTGTINYSNSCLRMLKEPKPDTNKVIQGLELAVEGATMTADIIRQIRQFVQKGEEQFSKVDLNQAVRNVVALISHEIHLHNVTLTFDLEKDIPSINGNLIQIEQVILNFIRNSIESMDRADKQINDLTVKTETITSGMIRLAVVDNGEGLQEDFLPKIFDAFFSTKDEGMGIGLSISRSIIESHQGHISARSLDRGGAEFAFELPTTAEG
jgi:C4-dicarboxylate-specific signal transduction histidine kinase